MAKTRPPAKRKSERFEAKLTPSPLRRSERGKNPSSTSSGLKIFDNKSRDSSPMERKREPKGNVGSADVGNKIKDASSYLALLKTFKKKVKAPVNASKDDCRKVPLRRSERERQRKDEEGMAEGQALRLQITLLEGKHPQWKSCSLMSQGKQKREQQVVGLSKTPEVESVEVVKKRKTVVDSNDGSSHLKPGSEGKRTPVCKEGASVTPADTVPYSSARSTGCVNTATGEKCVRKIQHMDEGQQLGLLSKLLKGNHPQWLSQGKRKTEQQLDELSKTPQLGNDEVVKKRKTVVNCNDNLHYLKPGSERKTTPRCKEGAYLTPEDTVPRSSSRSTSCGKTITDEKCDSTSHNLDRNVLEKPKSNLFEFERRKLIDAQKSLSLLLKPEISKLCGVLQLSDVVKAAVEKLLEYVLNNHHVNTEPARILQAFQISLCWAAASFIKQKVDHKESLSLAKQHLKFNCNKEEADYVYSMLRCLKETFLHRAAILKAAEPPEPAELSSEDALKNHSHAKTLRSTASSLQKVKSEVEDLSMNLEYLAQKDVSKSIKDIYKKFKKKMTKLHKKQRKDLKTCEEEKERLEREQKTESVVIRSCYQNSASVRTERLKMLEKIFKQQKHHVDIRLERLKALHLKEWSKMKEKEKQWVEKVESWACVELLNRSPSNGPKPLSACLQISEQVRVDKDPEDFASLRQHGLDKFVHSKTGGLIGLSGTPDSAPVEAVPCGGSIRTVASPARPLTASGALDTMISGAALFTDCMEENKASSAGDDQELITDGRNSDKLDVPEIVSSTDRSEKVVTSNLRPFEERIHNADTLPISGGGSDGEVRLEMPKSVSSTDVPQQPLTLDLSSVQQKPNVAALSIPDGEAPLGLYETVSSGHGLHNVASVSTPSFEEQIHVVTATIPESGMCETVSSNDVQGNLVSVDPPSEEQTPENATEYETVCSSHGRHNAVSVSAPSSEEQIQAVTVTIPDQVIDLGVLETVSSNGSQGDRVSVYLPSEEQIPDKATEFETVSSVHRLHNIVSVSAPSYEEQSHVVTVTIPDKEVGLGVLETVSSNDGLVNLVFVNPPSSEEQIPEKSNEHEIVSSSHGLHNLESLSQPSSQERIHVATVTMPVKEVESGVFGTVSSNDDVVNLVSVTAPSSGEQIPEKATEHESVSLSQIHVVTETMPDKEVESGVLHAVSSNDGLGNLVSVDSPSSEEHNPEKATEKENSELQVMASNIATGVNQQDGVDTAVDGNSYGEIRLVNSLPVQPVAALVLGDSLMLDQVQDTGTLLASLTSVQCGDAQASEMLNSSQPFENPVSPSVVTVAYDHTDNHVPDNVHGVQVPLLPSSSASDHSPGELYSVAVTGIQPISEDHTFNQVAQAPMQFVENLPDLSDQTVLRPMTSSSLQQPVDIPTSEFGLLFPDARATSVTYAFNTRPIHSAPQGVSQMPLPTSTDNDPLEKELEILDKKTGQAHKSHEDMKLRLKCDCDKEMEEAIAEIRHKYDIRYQEIDAEFHHKKKELDAIRDKVLMNKILALAYGKYMDLIRASSASGAQQNGNFIFPQQLDQLSMQQNTQRHSPVASSSLVSPPGASLQTSIASLADGNSIFIPEPDQLSMQQNTQRHFPVASSSLASLPAASLQTSIASLADGNAIFIQQLDQLSMQQNTQRHSPVVASSSLVSPPPASLQTSIASLPGLQGTPHAPATNPHCTSPPMRTVPLLPAHFPNFPARPPHIGSFSSTGIPRGGGGIRSPAPHLQPFRPYTSMLNQQSHSNSPATSLSLPHIPRLPSPMHQSAPYNRAHHPESAGGLPALLRSNVSALELVINSRSGANQAGSFPSQPNLGSNLGSTHGACVNPVHTGGSNDIVCLSDDE